MLVSTKLLRAPVGIKPFPHLCENGEEGVIKVNEWKEDDFPVIVHAFTNPLDRSQLVSEEQFSDIIGYLVLFNIPFSDRYGYTPILEPVEGQIAYRGHRFPGRQRVIYQEGVWNLFPHLYHPEEP